MAACLLTDTSRKTNAEHEYIGFQYAYGICLNVPAQSGISDLRQIHSRVFKVVDIPDFENVELYPAIEDIEITSSNGIEMVKYKAFILFQIPVKRCRGKTGDEIQKMLIPYAHKVLRLVPHGTYENVDYSVGRCHLDNIVITDDIPNDESDYSRWIRELSDAIAQNPCGERDEENIVIYDENSMDIKEPCVE